MGTISLQIPILNQPDTTEDVKLINSLTTLQTVINGQLDATNLTAATAQSASVNQSGQTVKGSSIIATTQNTSSTSFTTLSTPDQVTGIVLPTAGLIAVWYQANWGESVSGVASAAIFVGSNQVVLAHASGAPVAQSAGIGGTAGQAVPLSTFGGGLASPAGSTGYSGDVTTGQIVGNTTVASGLGGPCMLFAAAGTYAISVQYKVTSGLVTVSGRRLYVQALSFA